MCVFRFVERDGVDDGGQHAVVLVAGCKTESMCTLTFPGKLATVVTVPVLQKNEEELRSVAKRQRGQRSRKGQRRFCLMPIANRNRILQGHAMHVHKTMTGGRDASHLPPSRIYHSPLYNQPTVDLFKRRPFMLPPTPAPLPPPLGHQHQPASLLTGYGR
ncbi:hypothetical protein RB195_021240 [Necator americanus]|uniref:Uncharacterized protein n=1 Tax=Necator americanus TaxID=51031 RepID=A0ABR1ECP3_NECAM